MSDVSSYDFGITFNILVNAIPQFDGEIKWYNNNLATKMLVPSYYFLMPIDGATIYESTNLPMEIISTPYGGSFIVKLTCSNGYEGTKTIDSNDSNAQYSIPYGTAGSSCQFSALKLGTSIETLNRINSQVKSSIPTSITFAPLLGSSYSAGKNVPMKIFSTPESAYFMVSLTCPPNAPEL